MPDQVSPPYADTPPTEQQGPTSWAAAGAAATGQPADNSAQQALAKAQNPDRSQVQPESPTSNAGVGGGVPLVLRPKRTGLAGVIGKIADVLTGTTRPEIFTDQNGNEFVYHPNLSRGQQWMRIGGDAFRAAGAGLAAGKGAGNMGRAMVAGTDVARERQQDDQNQEQQMDQKANQDMLNRANMTILRMNMVEQSWRASRLQIEANEHDAAFSENRVKFFQAMGGQVLGTAEHPGDLSEVLHINPELAKDFVQRHIIEPVPTIDADGHAGVTFVKMPNADWRNQMVPSGATFHSFNPATHQIEEHQAADGMTKGDQSDLDAKAQADNLKYQSDVKEQKLKDAQAKNLNSEAGARDKELPSKIEENQASTREKNATARKSDAEAEELNPTAGSGAENPLIDQIGLGKMAVDRLGYLLAKSPQLLQAVTRKYPDFDNGKVKSYIETRGEFTHGKISGQLNGGGTAMKHLRELLALNTMKSHVPGTAAYNAYMNKVGTVSSELARFYGTDTVPGIAEIKDTLAANTPGSRERAIRTQAASMVDKLHSFEHQWRTAAPSPNYITPMPGIDLDAKEALAALSPSYAESLSIKMKAPNGDVSSVPYARMKEAIDKGATVVDE